MLKSVSMDHGLGYAVVPGITRTPLLHADNWAILPLKQVRINIIILFGIT